ncbi:hypothetical protein BKG91_05255 [Rodentibacter caecimuris]|uniref:Uncharacterized protein n=1 Tax=Rodentibacter caecimuris TaxID=1796644 RepID=A0AAJ3K5E5_9PAST|nr:hypothetical protein BKG90_02745 [Rodentibacter heylii]OOF74727.1 hypothetical protein BKG91_05255 [Rodentibacter heylii]OOF76303.1 hypothetical protein BKG99_06405 [Rodentibacter heylii]
MSLKIFANFTTRKHLGGGAQLSAKCGHFFIVFFVHCPATLEFSKSCRHITGKFFQKRTKE